MVQQFPSSFFYFSIFCYFSINSTYSFECFNSSSSLSNFFYISSFFFFHSVAWRSNSFFSYTYVWKTASFCTRILSCSYCMLSFSVLKESIFFCYSVLSVFKVLISTSFYSSTTTIFFSDSLTKGGIASSYGKAILSNMPWNFYKFAALLSSV